MANTYFHKNVPIGFLFLICLLFIYRYLEINSQDEFPIIIDNTEDYDNFFTNTSNNKTNSIAEVKENISRCNTDPVIVNNIRRSSVKYLAVIVVQVRSNTFFFENLIQSLKVVLGIQRALIIFSHATYSAHINAIVTNVTFADYVQIFYPYSIQLHPKAFPGDDPNFYLIDSHFKSNNGRRNAARIEKKHHWWWTVNFVFDHLRSIELYNGTVIFLEEHQHVAKDFIYILTMLEYAQSMLYRNCMIFSLAVLKPDITKYYEKVFVLGIRVLGSTQDMMGIGFNRTVWNDIKNSSDNFCNYNDVDWTRSLVYSLIKIPNRTYSVLSIDGPRVFRFNICRSHHCGDVEKVHIKQTFMSKIKNGLFPSRGFVRQYNGNVKLNRSEGHGGWDDARDHALCKYFTEINRN